MWQIEPEIFHSSSLPLSLVAGVGNPGRCSCKPSWVKSSVGSSTSENLLSPLWQIEPEVLHRIADLAVDFSEGRAAGGRERSLPNP